MNYLQDYKNGHIDKVWQSLIELDIDINKDEYKTAALEVANEVTTRFLNNLNLLIEGLDQMGYQFKNRQEVFERAPEENLNLIEKFEKEIGALPLFFKALYQKIGSVDLRGEFEHWSPPGQIRSGSTLELIADPKKCYSDPLYIPPLRALLNEIEARTDEIANLDANESLLISFSGDAIEKCEGEGGLYGILLPDASFDTDFEGPISTSFGDYLRNAMRWAGFPGLIEYQNPPIDDINALRKNFLEF